MLQSIPNETIRERRSQVAVYSVLNKKFITDIANIRKIFIITIYENVTNYYNSIAQYLSACTIKKLVLISIISVLFKSI